MDRSDSDQDLFRETFGDEFTNRIERVATETSAAVAKARRTFFVLVERRKNGRITTGRAKNWMVSCYLMPMNILLKGSCQS